MKKQWRKKPQRNNVTVHRFRVQRSAPPLPAEAASLIESRDSSVAESDTRVRDKDKIEDPKFS